MITTTMENDLIIPGDGYDAFIDFLTNVPSQPELIRRNRRRRNIKSAPTVPSSASMTNSSHEVVRDNEWDANYQALQSFHAKAGNCSVPFGKDTGALRSWTERQKKLYASSKLEPEKVDDLKALNFDFTVKKPLSTRSVTHNVPKPATKPAFTTKTASTTKKNKSKKQLEQQQFKKQCKENKPSAAKAHMDRKPSLTIDDEDSWNKQLEALKNYQAKNGNCSVPFGKDTGALRSWTERQKKLYASSKLEPDRVEKMIKLGFAF